MISETIKYEIFNDETQQSVSVIAYDNEYASLELPTMELMMNRDQLLKLSEACKVVAQQLVRG